MSPTTRNRDRDNEANRKARKSPFVIPKTLGRRPSCNPGGVFDRGHYRLFAEYEGLRFRASTLADFLHGPRRATTNVCRALPWLPHAPRFAAPTAVCVPHERRDFGRRVPARCVRARDRRRTAS